MLKLSLSADANKLFLSNIYMFVILLIEMCGCDWFKLRHVV